MSSTESQVQNQVSKQVVGYQQNSSNQQITHTQKTITTTTTQQVAGQTQNQQISQAQIQNIPVSQQQSSTQSYQVSQQLIAGGPIQANTQSTTREIQTIQQQTRQVSTSKQPTHHHTIKEKIIVQEGGQSRQLSLPSTTQKIIRSESPLAGRKIIQNLYSPNATQQQVQIQSSPQTVYVTSKKQEIQVQPQAQYYRQVIQVPVQVQEKVVYVEDKVSKERVIELETRIQELLIENNKLRSIPPQIQYEEKIQYVEDDTKIRHLEHKMGILINEIDKLNKVVSDKASECDHYRSRLYELESLLQTRQSEGDYWKQKYQEQENQSRTLLEQIQQFRIDIENYSQTLIIRNEEIQTLKSKQQSQENSLRSSTQRVTSYEERINAMVIEIERLTNALKTRSEENDQLRTRYIQLENQVSNLYKPQINEYQNRQDSLRNSIRQVETQNSQLKIENDRLQIYVDENRRLQELLNQRAIELDEQKRRIYQLTVQVEEYSVSESQSHILAQEIERLQKENKTLEEELSQWRYKYAEFSHLEHINRDLLLNQVLHCAEIESLRQQLTQRLKESVQVKTVEIPIRTSQRLYETTSYTIENTGSLKQSQGLRTSQTYGSRY